MKQVRLYEDTHARIKRIVKARKEKQPTRKWDIQSVVADIIEKAEKRECK